MKRQCVDQPWIAWIEEWIVEWSNGGPSTIDPSSQANHRSHSVLRKSHFGSAAANLSQPRQCKLTATAEGRSPEGRFTGR